MLTFAVMQYTLKKSLGQHFLKDENICKKIVDTYNGKISVDSKPQCGTKFTIIMNELIY